MAFQEAKRRILLVEIIIKGIVHLEKESSKGATKITMHTKIPETDLSENDIQDVFSYFRNRYPYYSFESVIVDTDKTYDVIISVKQIVEPELVSLK